MMGRKRTLTLFLFFLLIFSLSALAQGPPEKDWEYRRGRGMMRGPMHHPMQDWAKQLNLTDEQVARLQELRESYLGDTLAWRNELVINRFDLRELLHNPRADANQVLAKQREVSALESKIEERAVLYQLEMRKVLTPDQIKLLPPGFGFGGYRGQQMMPGRGRGMGRE
jgi:Spy/CpxP family protein refolding chaperone